MSGPQPPARRSGYALGTGTFAGRVGVRISGSGHYLPAKKLTNDDLMCLMDTSDEWIVQRTGIRERRIIDPAKGESTCRLASEALKLALADAGLVPADLDLLICATMTPEMPTPGVASLVSEAVGLAHTGCFDLNAACSGFVYAMNVGHDLLRGGAYRKIAVVGADTLSTLMLYRTLGRNTAIIFGDGAGAVILEATDDTTKGVIAQSLHADGSGWKDIYTPRSGRDFPPGVPFDEEKLGHVQMNGNAVYRFAVGKFQDLIAETLDRAGLTASDIDMFVCHQSNSRILESARERFDLPKDKLYVNIDRVGNTVAASVPICFDELRKAGRIQPGMKVMLLAFGAGLTWGSSLWQL